MNTFRIPLSFWLVCLTLCLVCSANADSYSVVPGQSVGKVQLGAGRAATIKSMGKPSKSVKWRTGLTQDTWLGPKPANDEHGLPVTERTFLHVIYRKDKVVQIEFNSSQYKTAGGISTRSSLAQFRAKHTNLRVRAYGYEDPEGGGYIGYYYDDVKRGITFEFGVQDNFDARTIPNSLRVHLPNTPVLPNPGGESMKADLELPVGPQEE